MRTILRFKTKLVIAILCIAILCGTALSLTFNGVQSADAATTTPSWTLLQSKEVTYSGQTYLVYLYKDKNFETKSRLFTATPVYHNGSVLDYVVTIREATTTDLSVSTGVSVSAEAKAFGNGIKSSLSITGTITSSYSTSTSDSHPMPLDSSDDKGFWAIYGYDNFIKYKMSVYRVDLRYEKYNTTYEYGWVKEGKDEVWGVVKTTDHYRWNRYETYESRFSSEFLTSTKKPGKFIFDYEYLGK